MSAETFTRLARFILDHAEGDEAAALMADLLEVRDGGTPEPVKVPEYVPTPYPVSPIPTPTPYPWVTWGSGTTNIFRSSKELRQARTIFGDLV